MPAAKGCVCVCMCVCVHVLSLPSEDSDLITHPSFEDLSAYEDSNTGPRMFCIAVDYSLPWSQSREVSTKSSEVRLTLTSVLHYIAEIALHVHTAAFILYGAIYFDWVTQILKECGLHSPPLSVNGDT